MSRMRRIAIVGDLSRDVLPHRLIRQALQLAGDRLGVVVHSAWVMTKALDPLAEDLLGGFAGIWVMPGSPYQSMDGALGAIRFARERQVPFLGTCGGFQHALVEYARNVLGVVAAEHAETSPDAAELVVSALSCSLIEQQGDVVYRPGTRLRDIVGQERSTEGYRCRFGLNPAWRERLEKAGLVFSANDEDGAARAFELPGHPFYAGTLFQPERVTLTHQVHPLIAAFVAAAALDD